MVRDLLGERCSRLGLTQQPIPDVGEDEPGLLPAGGRQRHPVPDPLADPSGSGVDAQLLSNAGDQALLGENGWGHAHLHPSCIPERATR